MLPSSVDCLSHSQVSLLSVDSMVIYQDTEQVSGIKLRGMMRYCQYGNANGMR